jgi:hypothetical protein
MTVVVTPASYGIKETREALTFGLTLIGAGAAFMRGNNLSGMSQLLKCNSLLAIATENAKAIPTELRDLSKEETDILVADIKKELPNIAAGAALDMVNNALNAVSILIKAIIAYNNSK